VNLKLEACQNCQEKCIFRREAAITLVNFRKGLKRVRKARVAERPKLKNKLVFTAGDNLSKNLQAANVRGCPASEIKRTERTALTRINPSLARSKTHEGLVNPSAGTPPFKGLTPLSNAK